MALTSQDLEHLPIREKLDVTDTVTDELESDKKLNPHDSDENISSETSDNKDPSTNFPNEYNKDIKAI